MSDVEIGAISGGSGGTADLFDTGAAVTTTNIGQTDTGEVVNLTGRGVVNLYAISTAGTSTILTVNIDGKTTSGSIDNLARVFSQNYTGSSNVYTMLTIIFKRSLTVTVDVAANSAVIPVTILN